MRRGGVLSSCGGGEKASANNARLAAERCFGGRRQGRPKDHWAEPSQLSSELVPFQEIDVYAKESGYVKKLNVDYGTRVKAGQVMAVLEIPELESQLQQDDAAIKNASDQMTHARARTQPRRSAAQGVAPAIRPVERRRKIEARPGGAAGSRRCAGQGFGRRSAGGSGANRTCSRRRASCRRRRPSASMIRCCSTIRKSPRPSPAWSRSATPIWARLMQAGTSSSTQAMPLVRLSQDDLFRLVIPVPESYVRYIRVGDPVSVMVPSLNRTFPGKVARFSVDVKEDTRTMHTEVDVPNPNQVLIPGLYAEATITLEQKADALAVPLQAVDHEGDKTTLYVVDSADKIESVR